MPCEVCHGRGVIIETEPVKGRSDEPTTNGPSTPKRSSGRQRSATKSEPEPEQVDPVAAERHSAAAAATAAIAAALHPEARHNSAHSEHVDHDEHADYVDYTEHPSAEQHAEEAEAVQAEAPR